jgi:magnesium transporter
VIVDCAVYEEGRRRPGELALEDTYEQCSRDGTFAWIGLHQPTVEEFESVRREFDLHELAVEDAIKAHQRPKLEVYGDSLFIVLKTARYVESDESVKLGEILLFVGDGFIVSVRHGNPSLHDVRLQLEGRPELLRLGPSAALHAIVDRVVDDYQPVIDGLEQAIEDVETQVFSPTRDNPAERIYKLKREVLKLHGALSPLLEPLDRLARGEERLVHEEMRTYFRDVHDHVLRDVGRVQEFRELLTHVLTANLTQASMRQNDDVRRISAWVAIIAVPTMIAGIYGMNFEHMPELGWRFGYPLVLAVIALACFFLYRRFRRAGWL